MAADGRVEIATIIDNKEAEKQLRDLRRSIEKTAKDIESTGGKKAAITEQLEQARKEAEATAKEIEEIKAQKLENESVLSGKTGDVSLEEFEARKQAQAEITYQLQEQEKLHASQNANIAKLEEKERAVTSQLEQQTASLEQQKAEAGEVERVIASQASSSMPQLSASAEAVSKSMQKGFRNILKWGFGIRSAFILMRRLRSAVVEGVKAFAAQDEETRNNINGLKASLATLKASWGAAFAPVFNAVVPILQKLISWLTTATNAIAMFFAALTGKSTYKKAIANNNSLAESYGGAGAAAEEAEGQIMGFDEINKLNDNSDKGGGGGGVGDIAQQFEETALSSWAQKLKDLFGNLKINFKDVFFNWDDINPETIAKKLIVGLGGALGAIVGFTIGGVPGAIVGTLAGVVISLLFNSVVFDNDGKLSGNEIADMLRLALFGLVGGIIGFAIGGPGGALIGVTVGAGVYAALKGVDFFAGGKAKNFINQLATALTIFAGAAIGFFVGGPAGALIGAAIGLGVAATISDIQFTLSDNPERSKYKSGLDWFIIGVLGLPSDEQWKQWGHNVVEWIREGFRDFGHELELIFVDPIKYAFEDVLSFAENFNFPHINLPHFSISWEAATGGIARALDFFGIPTSLPHISVQWYARGGIVDGATLFGAGEAGREAVIPLERHTEWIRLVADSLIDRITSNNRLADYISGMPLPALVTGGVVPPRALSGGGSALSDGDIDRLVSGITAALSGGGNSDGGIIRLYLDGRQIAETVTKHQTQMNRGRGR